MSKPGVAAQAQGAIVRQCRLAAGARQEAWARATGVRQSRISMLERGAEAALAAHRDAIVDHLGIPWADIVLRAQHVAAQARRAARAVGVDDIERSDPDTRYGLVRFVAEALYPGGAASPAPAWTAEDAHDAIEAELVERQGLQLDFIETPERVFMELKAAHGWPWGSLDELRADTVPR